MRNRRNGRNRLAGESGQSIVELALTLPLLLLLICGMLELGWVGSAKLALENITREGVRAGIVATSAADNTSKVISRINGMKPAYMTDDLDIRVSYSGGSNFRAGDITVTTSYDLPAITPLTGFLADGGVFHLQAECTMKMS